MVEGGQDLYYGLTGNQEATSWNVIRDTAFQGHEEEYYLVEALISQGAATGTQLVESMGYAETARMEGAAAKNQGSKESVASAEKSSLDLVYSNKQKIIDALKRAPVEYRKNPKTGIMEPYMKQVQITDDYKIILRKDTGEFNHGDLDHWNLEIQTVQSGNTKYDLHLYLGDDGNLLPFTEDNVYIPKKSPFH